MAPALAASRHFEGIYDPHIPAPVYPLYEFCICRVRADITSRQSEEDKRQSRRSYIRPKVRQ